MFWFIKMCGISGRRYSTTFDIGALYSSQYKFVDMVCEEWWLKVWGTVIHYVIPYTKREVPITISVSACTKSRWRLRLTSLPSFSPKKILGLITPPHNPCFIIRSLSSSVFDFADDTRNLIEPFNRKQNYVYSREPTEYTSYPNRCKSLGSACTVGAVVRAAIVFAPSLTRRNDGPRNGECYSPSQTASQKDAVARTLSRPWPFNHSVRQQRHRRCHGVVKGPRSRSPTRRPRARAGGIPPDDDERGMHWHAVGADDVVRGGGPSDGRALRLRWTKQITAESNSPLPFIAPCFL